MVLGFCIGCQTADRDPVEPLLPQYSEQGLNAAGCIYNDSHAWVDICTIGVFFNDCQYIRILYDSVNTSTTIKLSGELFGLDEQVIVGFELYDLVIGSENDLKALEGRAINLDDVSGRGFLEMNNADTENGVLFCNEGPIQSYGQLHIRRVSTRTNSSGSQTIFAGTFGFDLTSPCWEYTMYQGRFDYSISSIRPE